MQVNVCARRIRHPGWNSAAKFTPAPNAFCIVMIARGCTKSLQRVLASSVNLRVHRDDTVSRVFIVLLDIWDVSSECNQLKKLNITNHVADFVYYVM